MPSSSRRSASAPIAVIVPMVSKKSASSSVKISSSTVTTPAFSKPPSRLNSPSVPKSGVVARSPKPGTDGVVSSQPLGLNTSPKAGPMSRASSRMIATTVVTAIEIRMAPLTLRTHSAMRSSSPIAKTSVGQPWSWPTGAELHGDGRAGDVRDAPDEARVDEPDEGDEQADADRDGDLESRGYGVEDRHPEAGEHEHAG